MRCCTRILCETKLRSLQHKIERNGKEAYVMRKIMVNITRVLILRGRSWFYRCSLQARFESGFAKHYTITGAKIMIKMDKYTVKLLAGLNS
jgi:hypothetical protein